MHATRFVTLLLAATVLAAPALAGSYVGGGTFVVKSGQQTLIDNGGVICRGDKGDGVAGGCLAFPLPTKGGFVEVRDAASGPAVAFQVCIDNNGDGICGGPQLDLNCRDQIFFSHDDLGRFHNPLGPLPTRFISGCEQNGGFPGYVILLCQGAHEPENGVRHTHTLTQGTIEHRTYGTGYGDFCGGGREGFAGPTIAKGYVVV